MSLLAVAGSHKDDLYYAGGGFSWVSITSGTFYSGRFVFNLDGDDKDAAGDLHFKDNKVLTDDETYIRIGKFTLHQAPDADEVAIIYSFYHDGSQDHTRSLWVNDARKLELREGHPSVYASTTLIGTSTTALTIDQEYEVEEFWDNTNGAVVDQLKIDGSMEVNASGSTRYAGAGDRYCVRFGQMQGKGVDCGCISYVRDVSVNDGSGSYNNSWPQDFEIGHADLDGDNASYQDFTDAGAGQADCDDWNDAQTGHDADVTYAQSGTSGDEEQLSTLETAANAGVDGTNYHIEAVQTHLVQKCTQVLNFGLLVRHSATNYEQELNAASTAYKSGSKNQPLIRLDERTPADADWTNTLFASYEVGAYRKTAAASVNFRVTAVYVSVARVSGADPAAATLKSVNGIALASIKSINGVAIASVKSVNGLTTS